MSTDADLPEPHIKFTRRLVGFAIDTAVDILLRMKPADMHELIRAQARGDGQAMRSTIRAAYAHQATYRT